ncbi:hypothetical protein RNJ44_02867 [Nakaseomyces bracarensis]|uniref:FHA domain-containing protein n=1 Tax=Nakaseomyces bracarensis TaxID=273131 RepID=A0ABR4P0F8_9SACH
MWIIRYCYEEEDGQIQNVSCCMKKNTVYTIGRSSKNSLSIKNDKSISRLHISLEWKDDENVILITNQGKLSKIGDKYIQQSETIKFETSERQTEISLGTVPIYVKLEYSNETFDIPNSLMQFKESLESIGINCKVDMSSEDITKLITVGSYDYRELFASVKNIRVYSSGILTEICNKLINAHSNFDDIWQKIEKQNYRKIEITSSITELSNYNSDIFFILFNLPSSINMYLKPVIHQISLEIHENVSSTDDINRFLTSSKESEIPIVINQGNLNTSKLSRNVICIEVHDIFDSLKDGVLYREVLKQKTLNCRSVDESDNDLSKTLVTPQKRNASESINNSVNEGTIKRKRVRRQKVQPLNSLSFFAGGGVTDTTDEKDFKDKNDENKKKDSSNRIDAIQNNSTLENETTPIPTANEAEYTNNKTELSQPSGTNSFDDTSNIGQNKNVEEIPAPNSFDSEATETRIPAENNDNISKTPRRDNGLQNTKQDKTKDNSITNEGSTNTESHETENDEPASLKSEMLHANHDTNNRTKSDIVKLVQDTKLNEVKRLHSDMVQIDDEELTDDAINKLGNLSIIEPSSSILRKTSNDTQKSNNCKWKGRKNFKKFVKLEPKYKNHETNTASRNEFIRNSASLITRDFVETTNTYRKDSILQNDDLIPEMNNSIDKNIEEIAISDEDDDEQSFSFTRYSDRTNDRTNKVLNERREPQLFVVDDEFEDSQEPNTMKANTNELEEKDTTNEPKAVGEPAIATRKSPRKRRLFNFNENNNSDSDDDDDKPRFKFSRQR